MRRSRIGIAAGAAGITVVVRHAGRGAAGPRPFTAVVEQDDWLGALRSVRAQLEAAGVSADDALVDIALLPPLSDMRVIPLPRVRAAEAEAVIRRDAARHFVGIAPPVAAAVRMQPTAEGHGTEAVAVVAAEVLIEKLHTAVTDTGWTVASVSAAHEAWLPSADTEAVVAVQDGAAHVIRMREGGIGAVRRVPVADLDSVAQLVEGASSATLICDDVFRSELVRRLPSGVRVVHAGGDAATAAAARAGDSRLRLGTASLRRMHAARDRRLAVRLAVAAVLLLAGAAAVQLWGAHRELDAVRHRRAAIRPQVEPLLALRDSADRLVITAAQVDSVGNATARISGAMFDVATLLPEGAWLTRLHATGDTLTLDGAGPRAGAALQALRGAGSLRDVRLVGAVQRELEDGSTTVERFRITARIAGMPIAVELLAPPHDSTAGVSGPAQAGAASTVPARAAEVW